MPVKTYPIGIQRRHYANGEPSISTTQEAFLQGSVNAQLSAKCKEIFQSSFSKDDLKDGAIYATSNSFVRTVTTAYNSHHDLILRPEDVWLAILTQFNFYVNAHAEELRHLFVAHKGRKRLTISATGTRYTVDFGHLAHRMGELIHENVIDPDLREWIVPNFSTTEANDQVVASVVMMSTLKAYFSYRFSVLCGLPSVTLLGERADWASILTRLEKLKTFGKDTEHWYTKLVPILNRMIGTFDEPEGEKTKDFWNKVCHYTGGGSGPTYLSGWITAFCFFNKDGGPLCYDHEGRPQDANFIAQSGRRATQKAVLELDGVLYPRIDTDDIPLAYAEVDVELVDNGEKFDTIIVAGLVGIKVGDSGAAEPQEVRDELDRKRLEKAEKALKEEEVKHSDSRSNRSWPLDHARRQVEIAKKGTPAHDGKVDTLQPVSGWWIFHAPKSD